MTRLTTRPASAARAGRQRATALNALQQQAQQHRVLPEDLRQQIEAHLQQRQHALKTAGLIDEIIRRYPTAPRFASLLVDRLLAADEARAEALREEVR